MTIEQGFGFGQMENVDDVVGFLQAVDFCPEDYRLTEDQQWYELIHGGRVVRVMEIAVGNSVRWEIAVLSQPHLVEKYKADFCRYTPGRVVIAALRGILEAENASRPATA